FRAQRVGFAIELLREEIEPATDRATLGNELSDLRNMGDEPVELLANISLAGDQERLLMQAVRIETVRRIKKCSDLLGNTGLDRVRPTAGRRLGARRQRGDLVQPLLQDSPQSLTFVAAHRGKLRDGIAEAGNDGRFRGAPRLLVLSGVG